MKEKLKSNIKIFQNFFGIANSVENINVNFAISSVRFELKYKDMPIGTLEFKDDCWYFSYSEDFKNQNEIASIVSFPDTDKVYKSEYLWSFFASRVPDTDSSNNASINDIKTNDNYVKQLREYGRKSITNPFDLLALNV